jgi:hypothetical protein
VIDRLSRQWLYPWQIWISARSSVQNMDCRPKMMMMTTTKNKKKSFRPGGGHPMTTIPPLSLTTAKIWSWVPEGISAKMDGLTDWLTDRQVYSDLDVDFDFGLTQVSSELEELFPTDLTG